MSQAPRQSRGLQPIRTAAGVFREERSTLMRLDSDGLRCTAIPAGGRAVRGRCASPPTDSSHLFGLRRHMAPGG